MDIIVKFFRLLLECDLNIANIEKWKLKHRPWCTTQIFGICAIIKFEYEIKLQETLVKLKCFPYFSHF